MHVPYSMDDRESDLVAPWGGSRNEYDYPSYEHDGDSLAQATRIIDPPDGPLRYTESDMRKVLMKSIDNTRAVDFQLAKAKDLLICVIDIMSSRYHMSYAHGVVRTNRSIKLIDVSHCQRVSICGGANSHQRGKPSRVSSSQPELCMGIH